MKRSNEDICDKIENPYDNDRTYPPRYDGFLRGLVYWEMVSHVVEKVDMVQNYVDTEISVRLWKKYLDVNLRRVKRNIENSLVDCIKKVEDVK